MSYVSVIHPIQVKVEIRLAVHPISTTNNRSTARAYSFTVASSPDGVVQATIADGNDTIACNNQGGTLWQITAITRVLSLRGPFATIGLCRHAALRRRSQAHAALRFRRSVRVGKWGLKRKLRSR